MSREKDFIEAAERLAETKRTEDAKQQCLYDFGIAADYGYQYAIDMACEWLRAHLGAPAGIPQAKSYNDAINELTTEFRKGMEL